MTDIHDPTPRQGSHEGTEIRRHFGELLHEIQVRLVDLGTLVLANQRRAAETILDNRLDAVDAIAAADLPINAEYLALEQKVFQILALQQPVASDLRFLVVSTRVLYEIERSGDLAVNIAKQLERLDGIPMDPELHGILDQLVEASANMFARGIEALATMDPAIGLHAEDEDERTDDLTAELFRLVTKKQDDLGLEAAVGLFYIGRFLERIADHGVNIAQNVTFAVTAEFPNEY